MLGTPKALGQAIEGEAVSRNSPRPREPEREGQWWKRQKELWLTREK
jgi:hypothetical protein